MAPKVPEIAENRTETLNEALYGTLLSVSKRELNLSLSQEQHLFNLKIKRNNGAICILGTLEFL